MDRIFLLSPAKCNGRRAQHLLNPAATFQTAHRLRQPSGVSLGEVFTFLSGLYFRGKFAYARQFASASSESNSILVITPTRGLLPADTPITLDIVQEFAQVDIAEDDPRYRQPLVRDVERLAKLASSNQEFVLLGSIATGKYVDVLEAALGSRLMFPVDFVGRGDMSRGGLMLRCAKSGDELVYARVSGAKRRGSRPPKLPKVTRSIIEFPTTHDVDVADT